MAHLPPSVRRLGAILLVLVLGALLAWRLAVPPPLPIKVGVLHSLSGTMAESEAPLVDALRLAAEEINAAGGLLDRPIELVIADGRSDPETFAREAARLIDTEKVSVLFACWTSACRKAVLPVVETRRHLMFYPLQYECLDQSPNLIYTGATPNQQILPGARWAMQNFGSRLYLVGSDYIFPRTANRLIRDLAHASGGQILAERYRRLGERDFSAIAAEIARLKPDVILNTLNGDSNRDFFDLLQARGLQSLPVLSFSLAEPELRAWKSAARHPRHYAIWSYFQSLPTAENQAFVRNFQNRFGRDRVISDPMAASYDGLQLWANAVREQGRSDPQSIRAALGRQSVPGAAGEVAIDAATRHTWRRVRIGQAMPDGQFLILETSPWPVRPAPYPIYRTKAEWQAITRALESGS
jgi:urea transport system substrate-binding protein